VRPVGCKVKRKVVEKTGVYGARHRVAVPLVSELVTNAVVPCSRGDCLTVHTDAHWVRIELVTVRQ
jgi:hypothetical protein